MSQLTCVKSSRPPPPPPPPNPRRTTTWCFGVPRAPTRRGSLRRTPANSSPGPPPHREAGWPTTRKAGGWGQGHYLRQIRSEQKSRGQVPVSRKINHVQWQGVNSNISGRVSKLARSPAYVPVLNSYRASASALSQLYRAFLTLL